MFALCDKQALDQFSEINRCAAGSTRAIAHTLPAPDVEIPVVDLASAAGKGREQVCRALVRACEDMGIFKVVNHGVKSKLMWQIEAEAERFFMLPQAEKDKFGPPTPLGYGSMNIGPNGDIGWIEYLMFRISPDAGIGVTPNRDAFRTAVEDYVKAVKGLACQVLDLLAEGLCIEPQDYLSAMLRDDKSDSLFRLNHYPPYPFHPVACSQIIKHQQLVGFGEHTDPQIISILRSNDTSGLQVCLRDGTTWVSVPPDQSSFFINVGDSLQVLTNGRFKSVKHRVFSDPTRSRISMVYFGGPPLSQKISPVKEVMEEGEESLYEEFTWYEYKKSAYKSRLGDYRLRPFEKPMGSR